MGHVCTTESDSAVSERTYLTFEEVEDIAKKYAVVPKKRTGSFKNFFKAARHLWITLYREEIETTKDGDVVDSWVLGRLQARIWIVPIPIRFACWWLGVKSWQ